MPLILRLLAGAAGGALMGLGAHLARRADARSRLRPENAQPGSPDARPAGPTG